MKLAIIPVTPFEQNCSLLVCEHSAQAAVVDPGGDLEKMEAALAKSGAQLAKVLLTHGHLDHCAGTAELARRHGVPIEGPHEDERFWIDQLAGRARMFGFGAVEKFELAGWSMAIPWPSAIPRLKGVIARATLRAT